MKDKVLRVNEVIKEEVSKILLKNVDFPTDVMVTVVQVDTSADIKHSKVFINILPSGKRDELVMKILNSNAGRVQAMLIKHLNMRFVPRISFVLDKAGAEVDRLMHIFEELNQETVSKNQNMEEKNDR